MHPALKNRHHHYDTGLLSIANAGGSQFRNFKLHGRRNFESVVTGSTLAENSGVTLKCGRGRDDGTPRK